MQHPLRRSAIRKLGHAFPLGLEFSQEKFVAKLNPAALNFII